VARRAASPEIQDLARFTGVAPCRHGYEAQDLFGEFMEGKNLNDKLSHSRYSVPAFFANRPISLRVYPERLVIVAEGQILCEHERFIDRSHHKLGRTIYDWRHYLAVMQRKPGALRNGKVPKADVGRYDTLREMCPNFIFNRGVMIPPALRGTLAWS